MLLPSIMVKAFPRLKMPSARKGIWRLRVLIGPQPIAVDGDRGDGGRGDAEFSPTAVTEASISACT